MKQSTEKEQPIEDNDGGLNLDEFKQVKAYKLSKKFNSGDDIFLVFGEEGLEESLYGPATSVADIPLGTQLCLEVGRDEKTDDIVVVSCPWNGKRSPDSSKIKHTILEGDISGVQNTTDLIDRLEV